MPHGHCYFWQTDLLFLHTFSDSLIFLSYCLIPLSLIYIIKHRKDLKFDYIFYCFAAFIVLCGLTHAIEVVNIWLPYYYISGSVKLATGIISIITAFFTFKLIPKILAIPSRAEIEESNKILNYLSDSIPELAWVHDGLGNAIYFNKQWSDYTGYPFSTLKTHWEQAIHLADIAKKREIRHLAVEKGEKYEIEYRIQRKDGVYHWFFIRSVPIKDKQDNVVRWFSTARDIEEFRRDSKIFTNL